ncbi:MAG: AMP-binding protein [Pelistega sp.]|nr:AMP-binding protein [Pelistega sp.]
MSFDSVNTAQEKYANFAWRVPPYYNIGVDVCDKWADGSGRLALIDEKAPNNIQTYTFDDLKNKSNQLANSLQKAGLLPGDRVGILLGQGVETAIAHIAIYKIGAIAIPLFSLFGIDALHYRLDNSGAKVLITNNEGIGKIAAMPECPLNLESIFNVDSDLTWPQDVQFIETQALKSHSEQDSNTNPSLGLNSSLAAVTSQGANTNSISSNVKLFSFWNELDGQSTEFEPLNTLADDPAVIIYTSGTTGKPKGALHAHRVLLGHLPGVEMSHNYFPGKNRVMWTPADWAWIGGLFDVLMPAWHHGMVVVACRFSKFSAEAAFDLMQRHQVTNVFLPPTALKMLRKQERIPERWQLALRSVASGGESLGAELLDWGQRNFGLLINEFYGQTECNMLVSSCSVLFAPKPGAMGKAVPGHQVEIINLQGEIQAPGHEGHIAVRAPDPVMFLNYWANPQATQEKFVGEYLLTGDMGMRDEEGYFTFVGRDDDVITSAGYRIGPGPIEDCILSHPAVSMVAVVGVPDEERTEIVTAFVILHEGLEGSDALKQEIQDHVRERVAAHEYPRAVHFVDELPMTTTGKIIRKQLRQIQV